MPIWLEVLNIYKVLGQSTEARAFALQEANTGLIPEQRDRNKSYKQARHNHTHTHTQK